MHFASARNHDQPIEHIPSVIADFMYRAAVVSPAHARENTSESYTLSVLVSPIVIDET